MGGKVMMEEELTAHEIEWKVMSRPAEEEEPRGVIKARSSTCAPDWG